MNSNPPPELNSSSMVFEVTFSDTDKTETIDSQFYLAYGPHVLQLLYPNVSLKDSGTYRCIISDHVLGATEVTVGSKFGLHGAQN